ncbi:MAG TPA: hypothetical protein VMW27_27275, partial [Thermoanaerobaculia bacterium]|nr:hypothetical protein [Thermoanaerobaculia bacterium]
PACAQILGLYWIDATAAEGVSHDYLLVANHELASRRNANGILEEIRKTGFSRLDAWISFGRRRALAAPLAPPGDVRVYALPGGTLRTRAGYLRDATNNAGLRWHRGLGPTGVPLPGRPVLYHVRRAALGDGAAPGKAGAYELITRDAPVLATARLEEGEPQRPADWPPFPFEFLDTGLPEGWFGYRVSGVDLFGRHSRPSAPAVWHRWEPAGEQVVHPSAVRLLDQVPPPPPTGVEAWVLDPADPAVVQDTAYLAWRAKRQTVTGLRVRWRWTAAQARQAPDTQEFRLYFHPGSALPAPDPGQAIHWQERIRAVGFDEAVRLRVEPALDRAGRLLQGAAATVAGAVVSLDGAPDLSGVRPREVYVFLERDTRRADRQFLVTAVDDDAKTVRVQGRPDLGGTPSAWVLGPLLVREYEIFLPASGDADRAGLPLVPSRAEPVVYAHVGVTAADDRPHAADARTTGRWSGRPGNEGRTAPPVKVFRVLRTPPPAPVPLPAAARVFATPADYHGRSFYTFRWRAEEHLKVHVFRALDDALFQTDWRLRPTRKALAATDPALFPPDWNAARRRDAAAKLNALARLEDYRMLPDDALRVLAGLPGNERAFTQVTLTPLDPADAATTDRPGPDEPPDRPRDPSLCVYIDTLDGRAANRYFYRALYLDGAHNRSVLGLAGPPVWLPEVEPPRAPVITRIAGGDREITLAWASNREPSLKEYRVYRTADPEAVRDVRRMEQIQVKTESRPPDQRPAEVTWKNRRVPGLTSFYYRVVAVDAAGNLSEASAAVAARAYDDARPDPPKWNTPVPGATPNSVVLSWTSPVPHLTCLVQRQSPGFPEWEDVSAWLSIGVYTYSDSRRLSGVRYTYRLKVRDASGKVNRGFINQTI